MAEANLSVLTREAKGKQAAKHLRLVGQVPGVLYGPGENPLPLAIDLRDIIHMLHVNGRNVVVNLKIDDSRKKIKAFIYDIQHDPISGDLIHVDLKHISLKEKIHLTIPIHLTGAAYGVKNEGAVMEHLLHSVDIKCLPAEIPEQITLDITDMHIGDSIQVKDLPVGDIEVLADPESVVVHLVAPRVAAVAEEEEGVEVEEGVGEPKLVGEEEE